jgi:hypothetical protein
MNTERPTSPAVITRQSSNICQYVKKVCLHNIPANKDEYMSYLLLYVGLEFDLSPHPTARTYIESRF